MHINIIRIGYNVQYCVISLSLYLYMYICIYVCIYYTIIWAACPRARVPVCPEGHEETYLIMVYEHEQMCICVYHSDLGTSDMGYWCDCYCCVVDVGLDACLSFWRGRGSRKSHQPWDGEQIVGVTAFESKHCNNRETNTHIPMVNDEDILGHIRGPRVCCDFACDFSSFSSSQHIQLGDSLWLWLT